MEPGRHFLLQICSWMKDKHTSSTRNTQALSPSVQFPKRSSTVPALPRKLGLSSGTCLTCAYISQAAGVAHPSPHRSGWECPNDPGERGMGGGGAGRGDLGCRESPAHPGVFSVRLCQAAPLGKAGRGSWVSVSPSILCSGPSPLGGGRSSHNPNF